MAALNTATTPRTMTDLDVEASHEGAHHREVFLVLRCHAGHHHAAATVRTGRRRGRSVGLVDSGRSPATRLPAVLRARAPTRTPATALGPVLGEGSCLSESCSSRCVELFFEALAAALPPVPVALDSGQLLAQPFDLSFLFPNAGIAGIKPLALIKQASANRSRAAGRKALINQDLCNRLENVDPPYEKFLWYRTW